MQTIVREIKINHSLLEKYKKAEFKSFLFGNLKLLIFL